MSWVNRIKYMAYLIGLHLNTYCNEHGFPSTSFNFLWHSVMLWTLWIHFFSHCHVAYKGENHVKMVLLHLFSFSAWAVVSFHSKKVKCPCVTNFDTISEPWPYTGDLFVFFDIGIISIFPFLFFIVSFTYLKSIN